MRRHTAHVRVVAVLAAVGMVAACSGGSDDSGTDDGSIVAMLGRLPAEVGDGDDPIQIAYGNFAAASELAGVERPGNADDVDAVLDWILPVTGISPDGTALVQVATPMASNSDDVQQIDQFADEAGWSLVDVDSYIEFQRPPDLFTVINGSIEADDLDAAAGDADDGVWSVGDGDDYAGNLDDTSAARPLGVPFRMGLDDGRLAVSRSTPALRAWLDDEGSTMADDDAFMAMAERLDDAGAYSAYLISADPTRDSANPFDAIAGGLGVDDGKPLAWFVYHYADDATAEAAVATIETILDGTSERTQTPWTEFFSSWDVTAVDDVVVAELQFVDGRPPGVVWQILFSRDTIAPL